jgi:hypothetical protein
MQWVGLQGFPIASLYIHSHFSHIFLILESLALTN